MENKTNHAPRRPLPPAKAIAHPSRRPWGHFHLPTCGHNVWVGLCTCPPPGAPRPLAKFCLILSPAETPPCRPLPKL